MRQLRNLAVVCAAFTMFLLTAVLGAETLPKSADKLPAGGHQEAAGTASTLVPRFAYVANRDSNDISAFAVDATTGLLSPIAASPFPLASSPVALAATPDGRLLFVAFRNSPEILTFRVGSGGELTPVLQTGTQVGGRPTKLIIDPTGKLLFSVNPLDASISAFSIDASSGELRAFHGSPFQARESPSGIAISPNGRFVYVSDSASGTISVYAIDAAGQTLREALGSPFSVEGNPGSLAIPASGKNLYTSSTATHSVSVYALDPVTGALSARPGSPVAMPMSPGDMIGGSDLNDDSVYVAGAARQTLSKLSMDPSGENANLLHWSGDGVKGALLLAAEPTGSFLFAASPSANTVTRYLVDPQTRVPDQTSGIAFPTGTAPVAIAIANGARPLDTGTISVTLTSPSLLTFSSTTGDVHIQPAASNTGGAACAGQIIQLAFSVPSIAVISTSTANPATSVCILTGQTDATFNVTTAANSGGATLTGFATGFTNGTAGISVNQRQLTIALPFTNIAVGQVVSGTITLASPAPTGGATVALATNAASTATISPASVAIAASSTTGFFSVTGVAVNTATFSASVAAGGYGTSSVTVNVLPAGKAINLPHSLTVAPGQTLPYPISIGAAATSPVSISFATGGSPGTATVSPNPVVIPAGATTPTTQPNIRGGALGPLTVTGSASGYASDLENVTVSITLTLNPGTQSVQTGKTATLTLSASAVAPAGGFTINTAMDDISKATVPSTVTIPAGSASATVTITGIGAGTTTLRATAPGALAAAATINVNGPPGISILSATFGSSSFPLGKNGVGALYGSIGVAAPAGNLSVTLTSSNTSELLLSTTAAGAGSPSIVVQVPAGSTSIPYFYAQALTGTGSATITATATGYAAGTGTATFVPSGFILQGGTSTTVYAALSPVYVTFVQLDPSTSNYVTTLTLRAGAPAVTVALKNSATAVGTLASSSIVFHPGDSQDQTTFTPVAAGSATISFNGTPTGYTAAANYTTAVYTVTTPNSGFSSCYGGAYTTYGPISLGKYGQSCGFSPLLAAPAPTGGRTVTLTSNSTKLFLSTSPTAVGSTSITVTVPAGSQYGGTFYLQARSSSGTATVTETVSGYNPSTMGVNLTPSGFIIQGTTTTTTFAGPSPVYVTFVQLDPTTLDYTATLTLAPTASTTTVSLANSSTAVGVLSASSLVFNPGDSQHQVNFQPTGTAAGTATITIPAQPTNYFAPANYNSAVYTVNAPQSGFSSCYGGGYTTYGPISLGKNAQSCGFAPLLAVGAPSGGRVVTLTSNSTKVFLSTSPTAVGTTSITLNVAAGSQYGAAFYLQARSYSGTVTITETVPGYTSSTLTVNLAPSGFIVQGGTATTTFSGPSPVYVTFVQLDPTTLDYTGTLTLAPGVPTATVSLANSSTAVGTLGSTSIAFNPGDSQKQTTYQPTGTAAGTSTITFSGTPVNYFPPGNYNSTAFTVSAPNSGFSSCFGGGYTTYAITLGKNAESCGFSTLLAAPAPTGGRTVTLTSGTPGKVLLSTSATAVGTASITLTVPAGSQYGPVFYLQTLSYTGTITVTETVPGYNPATMTIGLTPSGFIVSGGTSTTTFSSPSPVYVTFAQLDPTTLDYTAQLTLRPGLAALTVGLTNNKAAVGTLGGTSIVFNPGDSQHQTTFSPAATGSATIGITQPTGYSASSNYNSAVYTVTAPNSGFSSCYGGGYTAYGPITLGKNAESCGFSPLLAAPAPTGGRTVSLTVSDTSKLLISSSSTAVGGGSLNLSVAAGSQYGSGFYLQALVSSGTATITETVPGYNSSTLTVNFTPSGFIVQSNTTTTTFSPASPVYVTFSQLDPSTLDYTGTLTLRPGAPSVTVGLSNSNTAVGTLGSSSLVFGPGASQLQTTFTPTGTASGVATIAFGGTPSGYSAPANYNTAVYTVNPPAITVYPVTVGKNLQTTTNGYLAVPAPTGGRTVTVTSSDATELLLSNSAATKGSSSLTFNLAAGQQYIPSFYVQALAGTGTATVTVTAAGYSNGVGTITLYPSGFALQASDFTTSLTDNPTTLTVVPAALDPMYLNVYQVQQMNPNQPNTKATLTLTDQSGTSPVGSITVNPVVFQGDDNPNSQTTSFQPLHVGTTLIKVTSPAGFTNASTEVTATVTQ